MQKSEKNQYKTYVNDIRIGASVVSVYNSGKTVIQVPDITTKSFGVIDASSSFIGISNNLVERKWKK